jgi:hypothetical protein
MAASYDVFTPQAVAEKMRSFLLRKVKYLLEPSVGTGQLLSAFEGLYEHADVCELNPLYMSSVPSAPTITKYCEDFLRFNPPHIYDGIVMNPPYHRFQDMDDDMRTTVRFLSPLTREGNIDLYVAFIVKCLDVLAENGTLIAIVPSTWRYNKSCVKFRNYLFANRLISAIHDYGSEKVFPGINVYCCILVITRQYNETYNDTGIVKSYDANSDQHVQHILSDVADVQNGIATLCDEVFIHDSPLFAEPCWKPLLKVSKAKIRHCIYPYSNTGSILTEQEFSSSNPNTYAYLLTCKEKLAKRDKGHKTYEAWYAFGRKQGIRIPSTEKSVYISTLSQPTIPTQIEPTMLFYSGIRVSPKTVSCEAITTLIRNAAEFICGQCSKRGNGWVNVTTTVLKQLPLQENE